MHFLLLFLLHSLVSLAAEGINTPITTRDVMRIKVVEVPPQTPEQVLSWLEQDIHLISESLVQKVDILLQISWRVACCNDGNLCFEE